MMDLDRVKTVPAAEEDQEFSYQVKKAAEGAYIAAIWGWDEHLQKEFHARDWEQKRPDIIEYDGTQIGTLYARNEEGCLHIRQFFILPEYQNRGIGSALLRRALAEADAAGRVTKVAFLAGNRVERLYDRFGFRLMSQRDHYCYMEREPQRGG
jgi:GNAT superfamily N-acetyltransferase